MAAREIQLWPEPFTYRSRARSPTIRRGQAVVKRFRAQLKSARSPHTLRRRGSRGAPHSAPKVHVFRQRRITKNHAHITRTSYQNVHSIFPNPFKAP
eukprot:2426914-Prymnesium_polylepis.2